MLVMLYKSLDSDRDLKQRFTLTTSKRSINNVQEVNVSNSQQILSSFSFEMELTLRKKNPFTLVGFCCVISL